jgi:hypothetical protein
MFAYKLKEGLIKKGEQFSKMSNKTMKQIVMNEYLRMGAPQRYSLFEIN